MAWAKLAPAWESSGVDVATFAGRGCPAGLALVAVETPHDGGADRPKRPRPRAVAFHEEPAAAHMLWEIEGRTCRSSVFNATATEPAAAMRSAGADADPLPR